MCSLLPHVCLSVYVSVYYAVMCWLVISVTGLKYVPHQIGMSMVVASVFTFGSAKVVCDLSVVTNSSADIH